METHGLGDLVAHREHRVERRHRLLEDHRDLVAPDLRHLVLGELREVAALEHDRRGRLDPARQVDQPHDRERGHRLAAAGLADDAERAARLDREVDAVDGADHAAVRVEGRAEVLDRQQLAHALPFLATACCLFRGARLGPFERLGAGGGLGTAMCCSSTARIRSGIARLEGRQQVTVLVHHSAEVLPAPVAVEVRPDPGPDRPPDLHRVRLAGGADDELVEAEVGLDDARQVVRAGRLLHQPDLLAELGEVLVGHPLERPQEAVPLEGEANRDQHLLHLVVGDAEDDRAPVGERHHEALVLELSQRLPDGAAARPELGREGRLDQALAGLVAAHDDRAAQDLDDLLPSRASLARLSLEDDCRCALDAIGHGRAPS